MKNRKASKGPNESVFPSEKHGSCVVELQSIEVTTVNYHQASFSSCTVLFLLKLCHRHRYFSTVQYLLPEVLGSLTVFAYTVGVAGVQKGPSTEVKGQ
ncbi:hypothetical protein JRQ81_003641 [Phrynocephalus forsythii]|uniref:Uncharacterized protein n=1 Tax=Phrynocephalus forsythii TaxID=171643 RepID=A0A9Q0XK54_9SAUR|nr:hypothetical protein JRQ81_003641 [Phrynocephalus forsythii]